MINATNYQKHFQVYLSTFCIFFGFLYLFMVTFLDVPKENIRIVDTSIGFVMGTLMSAVLQYYLGSSKGSADKTGVLNKEVKESKTEEE
jgi:hypothetical protein